MKDILISNCEKKYVTKCIENNTRVDGRAFNEFRDLKIEFGRDWGCCHVSLGGTKVLAQVSCEIQQPKLSRPQEGILHINVELSPMGAPNFEAGRQSELSVHLNRMLEKCVKDSKAVDLESLCIKQNEKVWVIRVDLNVLNHEGNLVDCASIAALTALAHFKRPDVTSDGENIVVHAYEQRDPIPTTLHHYPVCVSYAIFNKGTVSIADPTLLEEGVQEAELAYAVNSFKEICSVHLGGAAISNINLIIECGSKAAQRAALVVEQIKECLEKDALLRKENNVNIFEDFIVSSLNKSISSDELSACLNRWNIKDSKRKKNKKQEKMDVDKQQEIEEQVPQEEIEELPQEEMENEEFSDDSDVRFVPTEAEKIEIVEIGDDSEEEQTMILNPEITKKKNK